MPQECCTIHTQAWEAAPRMTPSTRERILRRGAPTRGCGTLCACRSGLGHGSTAALCGSPGPPPHALRARAEQFVQCVLPMRGWTHHAWRAACPTLAASAKCDPVHNMSSAATTVCTVAKLFVLCKLCAALTLQHGRNLSGERVVQRPHQPHKMIKHDVAQGSRATPEGTRSYLSPAERGPARSCAPRWRAPSG